MPLPLRTERLLLRPATPDDVEPMLAVLSDPEVVRYLSGTTSTREEVEGRIQRKMAHQAEHGFSTWTVEVTQTGEVIGDTGLQLLEQTGPEVEIGWRIARRHWGRGYATEAALAALVFGFEEIGLERIVAVAHPENVASIRVMEKIGLTFVRNGVFYGRPGVMHAAKRLR
jgi:RimJ/RimL family protein N-acetyltransferase